MKKFIFALIAILVVAFIPLRVTASEAADYEIYTGAEYYGSGDYWALSMFFFDGGKVFLTDLETGGVYAGEYLREGNKVYIEFEYGDYESFELIFEDKKKLAVVGEENAFTADIEFEGEFDAYAEYEEYAGTGPNSRSSESMNILLLQNNRYYLSGIYKYGYLNFYEDNVFELVHPAIVDGEGEFGVYEITDGDIHFTFDGGERYDFTLNMKDYFTLTDSDYDNSGIILIGDGGWPAPIVDAKALLDTGIEYKLAADEETGSYISLRFFEDGTAALATSTPEEDFSITGDYSFYGQFVYIEFDDGSGIAVEVINKYVVNFADGVILPMHESIFSEAYYAPDEAAALTLPETGNGMEDSQIIREGVYYYDLMQLQADSGDGLTPYAGAVLADETLSFEGYYNGAGIRPGELIFITFDGLEFVDAAMGNECYLFTVGAGSSEGGPDYRPLYRVAVDYGGEKTAYLYDDYETRDFYKYMNMAEWWGEYVCQDTFSSILITGYNNHSFLFSFSNLRNGEYFYNGAAAIYYTDDYKAAYSDLEFSLSADSNVVEITAADENSEWAHLAGSYARIEGTAAENEPEGDTYAVLRANFSGGSPGNFGYSEGVLLPSVDGELPPDSEIAMFLANSLSEWTGLDFTLNGVSFNEDSIVVDWSKDSTLIAGLDDREQKTEFFFYDAVSLNWFMMDSLAETLTFNFKIPTIYFNCEGGPVTFPNPEDMAASGLSELPADQSYEGSAFFVNHAGNK